MKNIYMQMYELKSKPDLSNSPRIKAMLNIINGLNLKNKNILDIGCFDGTFLSQVENRNNNFYGLDASDYAIKEARKKGLTVKQFFFDDVTKIPFPSNYFDIINAGEIIEHIYDTDFFLEEIRRLLKVNGLLLISTPNLASLGRRLLLLMGINPIIEVSPNEEHSPGHIRYFTFKTLKYLLEKHNFEIILMKSDILNLSPTGNIRLTIIPKFFPNLGQSIIYLCKKLKKNA